MKKNKLVIFLLVLTVISLACGASGSDVARESTVQAISTQVSGTGTAAAEQGAQTTQAADLSAESLTATAAAFAPILAELPK